LQRRYTDSINNIHFNLCVFWFCKVSAKKNLVFRFKTSPEDNNLCENKNSIGFSNDAICC